MRSPPYILLLLAVLVSCDKADKGDKGYPEHHTLFSLLPPSSSQVDFINQITETEQFNIIEYLYFNNGAGVAAGDLNNDGLADLYFTSNQHENRLFLNKGELRFEDITKAAGVAGTGDWSTGVTMADIDGDGFLDIYVCHVGHYKGLKGKNQLFINGGDLTFTEQAGRYGLDFQGFSTQAAFFDYDLDGDLDMYLLNHSVHTSRSYGKADLRLGYDEFAGDRLYRNDQTDRGRLFRDVTRESGIYSSPIGYGLGINISDINNDGFPDIFISNDFHEHDYLYINNQNGTFSERLTEMLAHSSRSSMGNDVGDINNDGLLDVVVVDMLPDNQKILNQSGGEDDPGLFEIKLNYGYSHQFVRNTLHLNTGNGMFSEIGRLAGIHATDWSWSPLFCDVDNDGWKDLFITSGIYRRANDLDYVQYLTGGNRFFPTKDNSSVPNKLLYEKMPLQPDVNHIFKNNGDLTFSSMSGAWGFEVADYSNGSTYADLDNDGDLDLVVNNINSSASIYRNNTQLHPDHHYLEVKLKGSSQNTRGTGARITLFANGQQQMAEQFSTRGFMSAVSDVMHFGLGPVSLIDSLQVRWPDLSVQKYYNLDADQLITLNIEEALKHSPETHSSGALLFTPAHVPGLEFRHKEDAFTDLDKERLIPHNLSSEGPALAVGDVNGDGLEDLFVGGAKDQPGRLFSQQNDGTFKPVDVPVLITDRFTEDVDAVLFDADGDGDDDLYIVRGGNEFPEGNPLLADRLLINNGKGGFQKSEKGALPFMPYNGSCVRPADFDGDGDLDLFVGTRSVPGAYGISPVQFLMKNDGTGRFSHVPNQRMEELRNAGMVTDAGWIDHDMDGDPDLVVVGEWMDVSIFCNDRGHFTNITDQSALGETSGWWNCIRVADVDLDGDPDLIGGNLGLNSMLKASTTEPVEIYLNDFDNNGRLDQVICSFKEGVSYPIGSLDELAGQINGLRQKYPSYSGFGGATVMDIFGKELLDQSLKRSAVLFETSLFLNNGDGTFEIQTLPVAAQFSPVRDVFVDDFDRDGQPDMVLTGNNYAVRPSLGRYDAGHGLLMLGQKGIFRPVMPLESGIRMIGDSRKAVAIEIEGAKHLVVVVNNGNLQLFKCSKQH